MRPWLVDQLNAFFGTRLFTYVVPNYFILISLSAFLGGIIAVQRSRKRGLDPDACYGLALWGIPAALILSRLLHVLQDPALYGGSLLAMLDPLQGDATAYGGFVGGA